MLSAIVPFMKKFWYLATTVALITWLSFPSVSAQETVEESFRLTFLGGEFGEQAYPRMVTAVDDNNDVFVAGWTEVAGFPGGDTKEGTDKGAQYEAFVVKLSPDLTTVLAYRTFGGTYDDMATALAIGQDGRVYVSGNTESPDFPASSGSYDDAYNGPGFSPYARGDVFVTVLSNDLDTVIASTFLGGRDAEHSFGMALAPDGTVYLCGCTNSDDFPYSVGAYDTTYCEVGTHGMDVWVARFDSELTSLLGATFLGDRLDDWSEGIAVGPDGTVYVVGGSGAANFPVTAGAAQTGYGGGGYDAFVSRFSGDLTQLMASTRLGGNGSEFCYSVLADDFGGVFVTGHTTSDAGFPMPEGTFDDTYNSVPGEVNGDDCFVTRFDPNLSTVEASTYLGGAGWEVAWDIAVDSDSLVHVGNCTTSSDFSRGEAALDTTYAGGDRDLVFTTLDYDLTELRFSTYIGGTGNDDHPGIALDSDGNVYLSGETNSTDLPASADAFDTQAEDSVDVVVVRIARGFFTDDDNDGRVNLYDNCPGEYNPGQEDGDGDSVGDLCDVCAGVYDPEQQDSNGDGIGDHCCCTGPSVGNVDGSADDLVTTSDLTVLIDHLFISLAPIDCPQEANIDMSGDYLVTMGDLTTLIDHLFITLTPLSPCP